MLPLGWSDTFLCMCRSLPGLPYILSKELYLVGNNVNRLTWACTPNLVWVML